MAEEKPSPHENYRHPTEAELELRKTMDGRLLGLRVNRYSWWTHWRDLADYILPRRYKWLITPNMMARGLLLPLAPYPQTRWPPPNTT